MSGHVALIGFGEAGDTFARAAEWGPGARAFDIAPERTVAIRDCGMDACASAGEAVAGASVVLSLVTADQALVAASAVSVHLSPGAIYCDCNSVAPATKLAAADRIEASGGHYVDVAVLAPVQPGALDVPLLLAGPGADDARAALAGLGFGNLRVVGTEVGRASAIKMIRSVMVKGIEALTAEMMLAAEAAGVTKEVLGSLDASERPRPWRDRAAYNLERMRSHGLRRAAEMEEVGKTLEALGVEPVMTRGTVMRQREMASALRSAA